MQGQRIFYEHFQYTNPLSQTKAARVLRRGGNNVEVLAHLSAFYANAVSLSVPGEPLPLWRLEVDRPPAALSPARQSLAAPTLCFAVAGRGEQNGAPLTAGQAFYLPPLQNYTLTADAKDPLTLVSLSLSGECADLLRAALADRTPGAAIDFVNPAGLLSIAEGLLFAGVPESAPADFARAATALLLSFLCPADAEQPPPPSRRERFVAAAVESIHQNLATVTVAHLAAELNLDRRYFSAIFHEVMHTSPQQYIQSCKMNWVRTLLLSSDLSVNEIVDATGYGHRNSLILAFQKEFGCSPTTYRARFKK